MKAPTSPQEWCDFYGVEAKDGIAILYKAVRGDYRSAHGFAFKPGAVVEAPDWDRGKRECGGGFHFAASPLSAFGFDSEAKRFLACPVALEDIRSPQEDDEYPAKVKARRVCAPMWEVDRYGKRVGDAVTS